jgi:hypothetical protein
VEIELAVDLDEWCDLEIVLLNLWILLPENHNHQSGVSHILKQKI